MHPGYCPRCGERVSPYAAGCAICGADLDPRRWQQRVPVWDRWLGTLRARRRRSRAPGPARAAGRRLR